MDIINKVRPTVKKIVPQRVINIARGYMLDSALRRYKRAGIEKFKPALFDKGINLIGDFKAATGLGQSIRLLSDVMENADIPFAMHNYTTAPDAQFEYDKLAQYGTEGYPYGINVFHINAPELPQAYLTMGKKAWNAHYNIAHWAWELEELPKQWIPYMQMANEFWTPSDFISNTLRKYTKKKCVTVPHSVTAPYRECYNRKHFNLPENKFLFLMMYASDSVAERKNPEAVIRAFKKAFEKNDDKVGLVIKITPSKYSTEDVDKIRKMTKGYSNIYMLVDQYGKEEVNGLMECVDVYVSLHRAEGFGLTLAESMLLGTPTIATNWSGNIEFQNSDTACMVDYKLVPIKKEIPPFPVGAHWAEADIDDAAEYMKKLYSDKSYYDTIKNNAKKYASEKLSKDSVGEIVKERVESIYKRAYARSLNK